METVNIQAAKTHLSRLVEEVLEGKEIVLAKAGKPLVRLVPYHVAHAPRVGGQMAGKIRETPDCWDSSEELLAESLDKPLYTRVMP